MNIILLSGKAESGKTTSALFIKEELINKGFAQNRILHTNYAGALKFICKSFFGWNGEKNESGRRLLQEIGTDVVRKKDPDFWVKFMLSILQMFERYWDYVIIDDVRFENEIEIMKNSFDSVVTIKVKRDNYENHLTEEQRQHPSETALDNYEFDYVVSNSGDIKFKQVISNVINDIINKN